MLIAGLIAKGSCTLYQAFPGKPLLFLNHLSISFSKQFHLQPPFSSVYIQA